MKALATVVASLFVGSLLTLSFNRTILKPKPVHAQTSEPFMLNTTIGGEFMVSNLGAITYCSGNINVTGAGVNQVATPVTKCTTVSTLGLPTTDTWSASVSPTSNEIWYLGKTTGQVIECVAVNEVVSPSDQGVQAACVNYGDL